MKSPSIMTKASIGTKISSCWCVSGLNRKESPPLVCAIEFDNFVEYIVTIYVFFIFFLANYSMVIAQVSIDTRKTEVEIYFKNLCT